MQPQKFILKLWFIVTPAGTGAWLTNLWLDRVVIRGGTFVLENEWPLIVVVPAVTTVGCVLYHWTTRAKRKAYPGLPPEKRAELLTASMTRAKAMARILDEMIATIAAEAQRRDWYASAVLRGFKEMWPVYFAYGVLRVRFEIHRRLGSAALFDWSMLESTVADFLVEQALGAAAKDNNLRAVCLGQLGRIDNLARDCADRLRLGTLSAYGPIYRDMSLGLGGPGDEEELFRRFDALTVALVDMADAGLDRAYA